MILDQLYLAEELLGKDVLRRARLRMPTSARDELGHLLAVSWCTLTTAEELHAAIAHETNQDVNAWHRAIVRAGVERTLTTVWRVFTRVLSVEALLKRAAAIYAKSYDRGAIAAHLVVPGRVEAVLSEWPDVPDFELDAMTAGFDAVLSIAAKKGVTIKFERCPGGAQFVVTFTP